MLLVSMPCGNHQSCRSTFDPNMLVPSWEAAYRLSQVPFLQNELRRTQVVGRMQQFFVGENGSDALLPMNTTQFEFGLNYYLIDGLKASSSYGRQFSTRRSVRIQLARQVPRRLRRHKEYPRLLQLHLHPQWPRP